MNNLHSGPAIFPLPPLSTPHPPQFHPLHRRSRRVVLRFQRHSDITQWGNRIITSLNHLYSYRFRTYSYPKHYEVRNDRFSPPLPTADSAITQRLLSFVHSAAGRFCCELRRRQSEHVDMVTAHSPTSAILDTQLYQQATTAIPIIARQVSLPTEAGTADLLSILPKDLATLYSDESKLLRPTNELDSLPKVHSPVGTC